MELFSTYPDIKGQKWKSFFTYHSKCLNESFYQDTIISMKGNKSKFRLDSKLKVMDQVRETLRY